MYCHLCKFICKYTCVFIFSFDALLNIHTNTFYSHTTVILTYFTSSFSNEALNRSKTPGPPYR